MVQEEALLALQQLGWTHHFNLEVFLGCGSATGAGDSQTTHRIGLEQHHEGGDVRHDRIDEEI